MRLAPRLATGLRAAGRRLGPLAGLFLAWARTAMPAPTRSGPAFLHDRWWNACKPGNSAAAPSSSSILSRRLYLATRSERDGAPVLICPAPVATARSAMVVSSVSPERWDITAG